MEEVEEIKGESVLDIIINKYYILKSGIKVGADVPKRISWKKYIMVI